MLDSIKIKDRKQQNRNSLCKHNSSPVPAAEKLLIVPAAIYTLNVCRNAQNYTPVICNKTDVKVIMIYYNDCYNFSTLRRSYRSGQF